MWDKDFKRVAEHFKIKLPDSQTFNPYIYDKLLDLLSIIRYFDVYAYF